MTEHAEWESKMAALESALRECMDCMSSLRDFVAEGGSSRMIGAHQAIRDADRAYSAAHKLLPPEKA